MRLFLVLLLLGFAPGAPACVLNHGLHVEASPSGRRVVVVEKRMRVKIYGDDGKELRSFSSGSTTTEIAFSPDEKRVVFCTERFGLLMWEENSVERTLDGRGSCSSPRWSEDGRSLLWVLITPEAPGNGSANLVEVKRWSADGGVTVVHSRRVEGRRADDDEPEATAGGRL